MRDDRWQNLLTNADLLDELSRAPDAVRRVHAIGQLLDGVLEVFPSNLDPLDDFEGFAVRRFVCALRAAIDPA